MRLGETSAIRSNFLSVQSGLADSDSSISVTGLDFDSSSGTECESSGGTTAFPSLTGRLEFFCVAAGLSSAALLSLFAFSEGSGKSVRLTFARLLKGLTGLSTSGVPTRSSGRGGGSRTAGGGAALLARTSGDATLREPYPAAPTTEVGTTDISRYPPSRATRAPWRKPSNHWCTRSFPVSDRNKTFQYIRGGTGGGSPVPPAYT